MSPPYSVSHEQEASILSYVNKVTQVALKKGHTFSKYRWAVDEEVKISDNEWEEGMRGA